MKKTLYLALIAILAGFGMVSFYSCDDPAEEDTGAGGSIYGKYGSYTYSLQGGTLTVGYVASNNYFEKEDEVKRSKLPNIIVEARGDMADIIIEGFVSDNEDHVMTNLTLADMKLDAAGVITFIPGLSTITGRYTVYGKEMAADRVKLNGLKVSGNRIAISEMRIFFGEGGADCVRFMDIQGATRSSNL